MFTFWTIYDIKQRLEYFMLIEIAFYECNKMPVFVIDSLFSCRLSILNT